jgi:hypothetical protein
MHTRLSLVCKKACNNGYFVNIYVRRVRRDEVGDRGGGVRTNTAMLKIFLHRDLDERK